MCGIGGFYNTNSTNTPLKCLEDLWTGLEDRGTHAHGLAFNWVGADKPVSIKQAGPASDSLHLVNKFLGGNQLRYVLLHTRYTTQGSVENNGNNHPIVRDGITLTHNGVLRNDKHVFSTLKVSPMYQVDSEALNVALAVKNINWLADNVKGSISLAWIDEKDSSQNVHLFTNGGNPLTIARTKCGNIVWASCLHHIEASGFEIKNSFSAVPFKEYILRPDGAIKSKWVSKQRKLANVNTYHSSQYSNWYKNLSWDDIDDFENNSIKVSHPSSKARAKKSTPIPNKSKVHASSVSEQAINDDWAYSDSRGWFMISEEEGEY
tara:strand:+ start:2710 stop:3669 length:960 start_codon:yes stop_codon:yes gene_type:complete